MKRAYSHINSSPKVLSVQVIDPELDYISLCNFQDHYIKRFITIQKYWRAYKARRTTKLFKRLPTDIKCIILQKVRQDIYYKRYKKTICRIVTSKFFQDLKDYLFRDYAFYSLIYINESTIRFYADKLLYILALYTKYMKVIPKKELLKLIKFDIRLYYFCNETSVLLDNNMYVNEFNIRFTEFIKTFKTFHKLHYHYPQSMFLRIGRVIGNINGTSVTNGITDGTL